MGSITSSAAWLARPVYSTVQSNANEIQQNLFFVQRGLSTKFANNSEFKCSAVHSVNKYLG